MVQRECDRSAVEVTRLAVYRYSSRLRYRSGSKHVDRARQIAVFRETLPVEWLLNSVHY
jgi:hypothetical protein